LVSGRAVGLQAWLTLCGAKLSRDHSGNLSPSRSVCVMRGAAPVALPPLLSAAHDASRHSQGCCCLVGLETPDFGLRDLRFSSGRLSFGIVSFVVSVACQVSLAFPGCPVLVPVVMSGHRWLGRLPHFGANPAILVCGCWALALFASLTSRSKGRAARWRF